jgi:tetratricopeptide (TPR) repeat protein
MLMHMVKNIFVVLSLVATVNVTHDAAAADNERLDVIVTRDGRVRRGIIQAETWKNVTYQVAHGMAKPVDVVTKDIVDLTYFGMVSPGYYQRAMKFRAAGDHERALADFLLLGGYLNADQRAERARAREAAANDPNNNGGVVEADSRKQWEKFHGTFEAAASMEALGRYLEAAEAFRYIGELYPEHRLAAAVWYRAGLNAALAGNDAWASQAAKQLEPMTIERGERRVRSLTQAIQVAEEVAAGKVKKAMLAARQVRLSPDGDGVWQHWKTFWSGVLLRENEYRGAIDELRDMLAKSQRFTAAERVSLQLTLAKAQMEFDPDAAALTCAAIDTAPGGAPMQREKAQLLLAQAWWQQAQSLTGTERRSHQNYRKGLIDRALVYATRLRDSSDQSIAEAANDLELALQAEIGPVEAAPDA